MIFFIGPLPPPVHGFSNICAAMFCRLESRAKIRLFDRSPKYASRYAETLRQMTLIPKYFIACIVNKSSDVYLALSGGAGQAIELPFIIVSWLFRKRVFVHHHSFAYITTQTVLNRILFFFLRKATHIVLSNEMGKHVAAIYKLEPSRMRIISNAAFYEVTTDLRGEVLTSGPVHIGYLSAISFEKGILEFFAVLENLHKQGIVYEASIAGPISPTVEAMFHGLMARAHNVRYFGAIYGEEKNAFYRNLDVLLFPSDYVNEAEPLVIHEAIRSGAHVIACERGAIGEILAHGAGIVLHRPSFVADASSQLGMFAANRSSLRSAQRLSWEQAQRLRNFAAAQLDSLLDEIIGCISNQQDSARTCALIVLIASMIAVGSGLLASQSARADVEYHDTLEAGLLPPVFLDNDGANVFDVFATDQETYDSNLYRLPSNAVDLSFIGPLASRSDWINSPGAGLDGQWSLGKQLVTINVRADENIFDRNSNLNYVSSVDVFKWNWALGNRWSGQLGFDYSQVLGGFYNTSVYTRDLIGKSEAFGTGRYQVGPHLSIYTGVLYADTTLSAATAKNNANRRKIIDFGADYATGAATTFGVDVRYTDARYSTTSILNGAVFNPDYRDEAVRGSVIQKLSEKTQLEVVAGYLKRDYPSSAIGDFSGYIWRISFDWHPTEKTEILIAGSRDLQADLSAQTDYFVSNAVSFSPTWSPSEKLRLTGAVSYDQQIYLGASEVVLISSNRRDSVKSAQVGLGYLPFVDAANRSIGFNFLFRVEHRTSNIAESSYDDKIGRANVIFKF